MTAYTELDSNKPDGANSPTTFAADTLANMRALRDMAITGRVKSFIQSRTTGTGADASHPQLITWLNATLSIGFRWNITWTGDKPTTILHQWTSAGDYPTVWTDMGSAQVNTFDASNNITASTNSGGFYTVLLEVWAKCLKGVSDITSHIAATGTAVHGLGTAALANLASMAITGTSSFNGTTGVGNAADVPVDATRVREKFNAYASAAAGATTTFELDKYGGFSGQPHATTSSTWTVAVSGAPGANKIQTWLLQLVNARRDVDGRITWPAAFKWIGGSAARPHDDQLALSGRDLFAISTTDGGTTYDIQYLGVRG